MFTSVSCQLWEAIMNGAGVGLRLKMSLAQRHVLHVVFPSCMYKGLSLMTSAPSEFDILIMCLTYINMCVCMCVCI